MENSLKRNNSIRKRIGEKLNNYNSLTSNLLRPVQFRLLVESKSTIKYITTLITIFPVNQNFKSRV